MKIRINEFKVGDLIFLKRRISYRSFNKYDETLFGEFISVEYFNNTSIMVKSLRINQIIDFDGLKSGNEAINRIERQFLNPDFGIGKLV